MGRKPKTTGPRARDPGAFKSVLVRTNFEGWRALKMLAVEKDTTLNALAVEAFNEKTRQAPSEKNLLLKENDVNEAAPMVAASAVANGPLYRSAGPPFSVGNMPSYIARASRIRRVRSRSRFRIN